MIVGQGFPVGQGEYWQLIIICQQAQILHQFIRLLGAGTQYDHRCIVTARTGGQGQGAGGAMESVPML